MKVNYILEKDGGFHPANRNWLGQTIECDFPAVFNSGRTRYPDPTGWDHTERVKGFKDKNDCASFVEKWNKYSEHDGVQYKNCLIKVVLNYDNQIHYCVKPSNKHYPHSLHYYSKVGTFRTNRIVIGAKEVVALNKFKSLQEAKNAIDSIAESHSKYVEKTSKTSITKVTSQ